MRHSGVVAKWNVDRGFGFVKSNDGGPDVFLHVSAFHPRIDRPREGMSVTFESHTNDDGRLRAERVIVTGERWSRSPANRSVSARVIGYFAIVFFLPILILEVIYWGMPSWVFAVYGGASLVSFVFYWQDKAAAVAGTWRVPETQLHLLGLVGGWPGAILAQNLFRHKTRKEKFARNFWLTVLLNVLFFAAAGSIIHFDWLTQLVDVL